MSDRKEEVNALWEEYQKVFRVYWDARRTAVEKAVDSVSDLRAESTKAYDAYRVARYGVIAEELAKAVEETDPHKAFGVISEETAAAIVAPLEAVAEGLGELLEPVERGFLRLCKAFRRKKK
jgi:hypothetical protein